MSRGLSGCFTGLLAGGSIGAGYHHPGWVNTDPQTQHPQGLRMFRCSPSLPSKKNVVRIVHQFSFAASCLVSSLGEWWMLPWCLERAPHMPRMMEKEMRKSGNSRKKVQSLGFKRRRQQASAAISSHELTLVISHQQPQRY